MFTFEPNIHTQEPKWAEVGAISELSLKRLHKELEKRDIFWGCVADEDPAGGDVALEYALVLTNDEEIQRFNEEFRGKDSATNVLSFPSDEPGELGDVILSYDTIAREAEEQGKALEAHVTHMIMHGILHLLGFDHEDEEEACEMESLETEILASLSIANPYAA